MPRRASSDSSSVGNGADLAVECGKIPSVPKAAALTHQLGRILPREHGPDTRLNPKRTYLVCSLHTLEGRALMLLQWGGKEVSW